MKRAIAIALVLAALPPAARHAFARGDDEEEEASDDEDEDTGDDEEDEDTEDEGSGSAKAKPAAKTEDEEEEEDVSDTFLRPKQNLTGHDNGTNKKVGEFERDRFFVDKVDSAKTEKGTLVQGSLSSSTFFYGEKGGAYPTATPTGNNDGVARLFTELRLQTDFRHIAASRWDARVDARARFVRIPGNDILVDGTATPENTIQSGLTGKNEYDIRELWLTRVGKRSDIFLGRQFIPDLGGVKIDGLRIDYAKSSKLTLIGFGGLFPVRGSRSIDTDYMPLKTPDGNPAGRFVATGGFGGAYRTVNAYGALGGVAQVPLKAEQPRFFVTSNGYLRSGSKLDLYHFAILDLLGSAAADSPGHVQLTNLSAGANLKPNARLRLTASFNRVDTETLNVQAGAFLGTVDYVPGTPTNGGNTVVQNEAFLVRLATNSARAGVSAGLGKQQRFELSTAVSYRMRPAFTLRPGDPNGAGINLPAAKSVEVWGSFVDRHSIKDARLALDVSRSFGVGDVAFQRSEALIVRGTAQRELAGGKGEWEAEVAYTQVIDSVLGMGLGCGSATDIKDCYGSSNNTLISAGGQIFYRLRRDWFTIATLHVMRITNTRSDGVVDPAIVGATGFLRIAKRF
ncbi:MAG: hypothetical protein HOV81_08255 [Kofleriaceae bacterium]|nr:hypothetical protein [Kofleriaceae bacterium]